MKHDPKYCSKNKIKFFNNFRAWASMLESSNSLLGHSPYQVPMGRLWYPPMGKFILGSRQKLMVINSSFTLKQTAHGLRLAAKILRNKGKLLIVDTRGEFSPFLGIIKNMTQTMPSIISFSGCRWVGGTLSNWNEISPMVYKYADMSRQLDPFLLKNHIYNSRHEKMKASYSGFLHNNQGRIQLKFKKNPDLLFIVNPNESRHIIAEAYALKIPTIALVDSNTNLDFITIPIPANGETIFWVYHCVNLFIRLATFVETSSLRKHLRPRHL